MKHGGAMRRRSPYLATALLAAALATVVGADNLYLIVTTPRNAKVSWIKVPELGEWSGQRPQTLIDEGLTHPQGACVDRKRQRLYIADPDQQCIFYYTLSIVNGDLVAGKQETLLTGVESRWVAVDGTGSLFFSEEPLNRIMKLSVENALRGQASAEAVYSGETVAEVNAPGGVAVDNMHVFWTNKQFGTEVGSVVRGSETPFVGNMAASIAVMTKDFVKSYGVCLAMGDVYFTDSDKNLYGMKKSDPVVSEISSDLDKPRGCVWDGDGTLYVADRGAGTVYSFATSPYSLQKQQAHKVFELDDAFGLAVFSGAVQRSFAVGVAAVAFMSAVGSLF